MRSVVKILCIVAFVAGYVGADEARVLKQGVYKSLGFMSGYWHYGEIGMEGERVMRIDTLFFGLVGQLGMATSSGVKLEGNLRTNFAYGLYTGGVLDVDDSSRNGQRLYSAIGGWNSDMELKGGYNLLPVSLNTTLYLQSGVGYYFSRTEFITMDRLQGYLYVPLELEGEHALNSNLALNFGLGYRYFIAGHHYSAASKYGLEDDYRVTQKEGFGVSGFLGMAFVNKDSGVRNVRLIYEYWNVGAATPMRTTSSDTLKPTARSESVV